MLKKISKGGYKRITLEKKMRVQKLRKLRKTLRKIQRRRMNHKFDANPTISSLEECSTLKRDRIHLSLIEDCKK